MENPRVRVYLDDEAQPIVDRELPTEISLDTTNLADGPHRLTIRAQDQWGREGVEEIGPELCLESDEEPRPDRLKRASNGTGQIYGEVAVSDQSLHALDHDACAGRRHRRHHDG